MSNYKKSLKEGARTTDYKRFLLESRRFINEIESVATVKKLDRHMGNKLVRHGNRHHMGLMDATSPAAEVEEFKKFCSRISTKNVRRVKPAISRYLDVLVNINFDAMKKTERERAILRLRNNITTSVGRIDISPRSVARAGGAFNTVSLPGEPNLLPPAASVSNTVTKLFCAPPPPSVLNTGGTGPRAFASRARAGAVEPFPTITSTQKNTGTEPTPQELTLRVRFLGEKVKGRTVECGTSCALSVDWGLLDDATIMALVGNELQRAREANVEVEFELYPGSFKLEENRTRIATRFKDDGFETPVTFNLTAPETPIEKTKLWLEILIHGRAAVVIPFFISVVTDLNVISAYPQINPVKIDLDKLIANSTRSVPTAILRIDSIRSLSAVLTIIETRQEIDTNLQPALALTSIANQLGQIAKKMNDVAQDMIWNTMSDPLKPTEQERLGLSIPLAKAATAGYELYDWLTKTAGMKGIMDRIDALPPNSLIIVRSNGVAIPWETIYSARYRFHETDDSPPATVIPSKFWGYRFEFETNLSPGQHNLPEGDTDRIELHRNAERKLTAVMNVDIDSEGTPWSAGPPVSKQRVAFTNACGGALANIQLKSTCSEARTLLDTERTSGSFVYFYCHGGTERPFDPSIVEVLQIKEGCLIEVADVSDAPMFTDAPIVFLNSCSSGPLASVSFDSFSARFMCKGALGLITTSFAVPAQFAARFGCDLILQYMNKEGTLGELLLKLRKNALSEGIPIGLFYMLRCQADISLKPN